MQHALRRIAPLAILVIALLLIAPVIATLARAHEPWTGYRDPKTGEDCCSGKDCDMVRLTPDMIEGDVVGGVEGVRIKLTRAQLLAINPESHCEKVDEFFPTSRIQQSPVGGWALCIRYYDQVPADPQSCIRCVFAPGDI